MRATLPDGTVLEGSPQELAEYDRMRQPYRVSPLPVFIPVAAPIGIPLMAPPQPPLWDGLPLPAWPWDGRPQYATICSVAGPGEAQS